MTKLYCRVDNNEIISDPFVINDILHLENGKHTNAQAIRRAKSLSRKGIKINYE
jgi:hypothetical protein